MSWRKGFFRIWVLLTVLWAGIIGVMFSGGILDPYVAEYGFIFQEGDKQVSAYRKYSDAYRAAEELAQRGRLTIIEFEDLPRMVFFADAELSEEELRFAAREVHPVAAGFKEMKVSEARSAALRQFVLVAAIPPAAILLLGLGVAWALAGFRNQR